MNGELELIVQIQSVLSGDAGVALSVFLSRYLIFVLAALVAVLGYLPSRSKFRAPAYAAGWSSMLAFGIAFLIGQIWFRERPFLASDLIDQRIPAPLTIHSFPSAHAAISFAVAMSLTLAHPGLGILALALAGLVAFGRVAAGVHYPTDALGGMILGILSALFVHWYRTRRMPKQMRRS